MIAQVESSQLKFQSAMLQKVSRTFALTIPMLPSPLARIVGNVYLLCRIADTIEDAPDLTAADKSEFSRQFIRVVEGEEQATLFSAVLGPRLSPATPAAERELIAQTADVMAVTDTFKPNQIAAIRRCVRTMATGMASFQTARGSRGLADLAALNHYCYCVAGVVGELLTTLFCDHSRHIAGRETQRKPLDNRGFANACFARENRIVLTAPHENVDDLPNLFVAANDRVDLTVCGLLGQIDRELSQRFLFAHLCRCNGPTCLARRCAAADLKSVGCGELIFR